MHEKKHQEILPNSQQSQGKRYIFPSIFISFLINNRTICQVAVLIHDFPHLNYGDDAATVTASHGKSWSITLNGVCEVHNHHIISAKTYYYTN